MAASSDNSQKQVVVSIIVPVFEDSENLKKSLPALLKQDFELFEVIVVDDASTDGTAEIARQLGARVIVKERNSGPGDARNLAATFASGEILFFVDADVVVCRDSTTKMVKNFRSFEDVVAVFGSYDSNPAHCGVVSQFRNLLHHYVHQTGNTNASTFWSGCGAIRRDVFRELDGFDIEKYKRPSIEDIELGYRICSHNQAWRIVLDPEIRVQHLKKWTFLSAFKTDLFDRAIPWSELILKSGTVPNDLNANHHQKLSLVFLFLSLLLLPLWFFFPVLVMGSLLSVFLVVVLNSQLYKYLNSVNGLMFALKCIPLHLCHLLAAGTGFIIALVNYLLPNRGTKNLKAKS